MEMTKEKRDAIVTTLYEKCGNGEISRDQREALIQKANAMFVATEAPVEHVESESNTESTNELSPREKYNMFKEAVYNKCTKGEITVEAREELLEKAREEFLTISE